MVYNFDIERIAHTKIKEHIGLFYFQNLNVFPIIVI